MNVLCWIKALFAAGQLFHTANFSSKSQDFIKTAKKEEYFSDHANGKEFRLSEILTKFNFKNLKVTKVLFPSFHLNNLGLFDAVRIMQFYSK